MRKANGIAEGSNHVVEDEVVLRWEDLTGKEDSHESDLMHDWDFAQKSVISRNAQLKPSTNDILCDASNKKIMHMIKTDRRVEANKISSRNYC